MSNKPPFNHFESTSSDLISLAYLLTIFRIVVSPLEEYFPHVSRKIFSPCALTLFLPLILLTSDPDPVNTTPLMRWYTLYISWLLKNLFIIIYAAGLSAVSLIGERFCYCRRPCSLLLTQTGVPPDPSRSPLPPADTAALAMMWSTSYHCNFFRDRYMGGERGEFSAVRPQFGPYRGAMGSRPKWRSVALVYISSFPSWSSSSSSMWVTHFLRNFQYMSI